MRCRALLSPITPLAPYLLLAVACSVPPPEGVSQVAEPDYWPTEGWRTSTPEEQGIDSQLLVELLTTIRQRDLAIDSVLVVRNGYLVLEAYQHPFTAESLHMMASCTKSVVSALVGIAVGQGYIEGPQQPVLELLPQHQVANLDRHKEAMTLEHLLTMCSGIKCRDSLDYGMAGIGDLKASPDWVRYVLDLPMDSAPGTSFVYCNGASLLLSAIVQQATGKSALAVAEQHLFGPLGITGVRWPTTPDGINIGWGEMRMRPRDMAKIGLLYLNRGQWDGVQVVPAAWVDASVRDRLPQSGQDGYGYQWWVENPGLLVHLGLAEHIGVYEARGYAGQFIFVVPEKRMVVVFCSRLAEDEFTVPIKLLRSVILPAATTTVPLLPNPQGVALLESHVTALQQPELCPQPVPPLPATARQVSGKTFQLTGSRFGFESLSLQFREHDAALAMAAGGLDWGCAVGLDEVFRITETGRAHDLACRGRWTDAETFVLDWRRIGDTQDYQLRLDFSGDQLNLTVSGSATGPVDRMTGKVQGERELRREPS